MNAVLIPICAKIIVIILAIIFASFNCIEAEFSELCIVYLATPIIGVYSIIEALFFLFLFFPLIILLLFQDVDKEFINFVISLFLSVLVSFVFFVAIL